MNSIKEQIIYFKKKQELIKEKLINFKAEIPALTNESRNSVFELNITSLKELKVAAIMDRFTLDSYKPECQLLEITPNNWKQEIEDFSPHLLFIESAWEGKEKLWHKKIANGSKEYFELTSYCQQRKIPIIFWNKEDPVWTDTFIPAARMADFVFTTEIDCIKKYKSILNHNRVYFLHFAAQPLIHNPNEKYVRKEKFCFAGAYYHKYPKRAETFDKFAQIFINSKGLDIYDRNYQNALPEHAFPQKYHPYILGQLDLKEIDIAYKGYKFGINMNSVSQSQTMFARRVYEMLASNTVTVGNYSRGVKNLFGDLTICTDDDKELKKWIEKLTANEHDYRKYRLLGLRNILKYHLYEDRLDYIVQKVFGISLKNNLPEIIVVTDATGSNLEHILQCYHNQTYKQKQLIIIGEESKTVNNIKYISKKQAESLLLFEISKNGFIAYFSGNDYYGKHYLEDMILTLRYHICSGIGKSAHYVQKDNTISLIMHDNTYKSVQSLKIRCSIFNITQDIFNNMTLQDFLTRETILGEDFYAVDEFNYCKNNPALTCDIVDDLKISDQGIDLKKIEAVAENINIPIHFETEKILSGHTLFELLNKKVSTKIKIKHEHDGIQIESTLSATKIEYIYSENFFEVNEFLDSNKLGVLFSGIGNLDALGVIIYYDKNKKKISPVFPKCSVYCNYEIPSNAYYIKLGIRISSSGIFKLHQIQIGLNKENIYSGTFLSRSNVLVLSNHYPSYDNLYKNMFVHKRVSSYKEDHLLCDVMRMNLYANDEYREFEGINVVEGRAERLEQILATGTMNTVCVHFLDRNMWQILKTYADKLQIIIWSHGADIEPWWRRTYNYCSEKELEKAKQDSEIRMELWKEVFSVYQNYNIHFVFVSQYAANSVFQDYGITIAAQNYHIIHNYIDTKQFTYLEKSKEDRKKFISIRPFASRRYANDLTVKTILMLSKKSYFNELEFTIIGNGERFEEELKPLCKFKNVKMEQRFLRQDEISEYYHNNGILLIPTRGDTQGVSRDEGMACGLVPVTNEIEAIPEFINSSCSILAKEDSYIEMVEGIERLYYDETMFLTMSKQAAKQVRKISSKSETIEKEENLILSFQK